MSKKSDSAGRSISGGRRKTLGALVGGAAIGSQTLPERWYAPMITTAVIPAHAESSPSHVGFGSGTSSQGDIIAPLP